MSSNLHYPIAVSHNRSYPKFSDMNSIDLSWYSINTEAPECI